MTVTMSKYKVLVYSVITLLAIFQTSYGDDEIVLMSTNPYNFDDLNDYEKDIINYILNQEAQLEMPIVTIWPILPEKMQNIYMYHNKEYQIEYVKYIFKNTFKHHRLWSEVNDNYVLTNDLRNFFYSAEYANVNKAMSYTQFIEGVKYAQSMISYDINDFEDNQKIFLNYLLNENEQIWLYEYVEDKSDLKLYNLDEIIIVHEPLKDINDLILYNNVENQIEYAKYIFKNTQINDRHWPARYLIFNYKNEFKEFFFSMEYANRNGVMSCIQFIDVKKNAQSMISYDINDFEDNQKNYINYLQNQNEPMWTYYSTEEINDLNFYNNTETQIKYVKYLLKNTYKDNNFWSIASDKNAIINELNHFFYVEGHANRNHVMSYTQVIEGLKYGESLQKLYPYLRAMLPSRNNNSCKNYISMASNYFKLGLENLNKGNHNYKFLTHDNSHNSLLQTMREKGKIKILRNRLKNLKKCYENEEEWYFNLKESKLIEDEPIKSHALRNIANNRVPVNPKHFKDIYGLENRAQNFTYIDSSNISNELLIMVLITATNLTNEEPCYSSDAGPSRNIY